MGTPVVPDVYIWTITSPGGAAAARIARLVRRQPALVVLADDHQAPAGAAVDELAGDLPYAGPAIRSGACASASTAASSGGASRQLSGTSTAPILLAANSSSTTSGAERSR